MRVIALAVLALSTCMIAGGAAAAPPAPPAPPDRAAALGTFNERVESYMALHRRIEGPIPPMAVPPADHRSMLARRYLASAIRFARAGARRGDIFPPAVARVFRELIAESLAGKDVEAMLTEMNAEHPWEHGTHAAVNESYPPGATHLLPAVVLRHLPALSPHLEFRILDHDLVLLDVHADLVVDYVPNAFGEPAIMTAAENFDVDCKRVRVPIATQPRVA